MTRFSYSARTPRTALLLAGLAAGWVACGQSENGAAPEAGDATTADASNLPDGDGAEAAVDDETDGGVDAPASGLSQPDTAGSVDAGVGGQIDGVDAAGDNDTAVDGGDAAPSPLDSGTSRDPIARGSYLVRGVLACGSCHSPLPAAGDAADPALFLNGRDCFATIAIPGGGTTCLGAPNLTPGPTGIGRYSDAQLTAMIFDGVRPDGTPLLAGYMPSYQFRLLTDDDAASVVAYLRSLPPGPGHVPSRDPSIPAGIAAPLSLADLPAAAAGAGANGERGRYLAGVACVACHSPRATIADVRPIDVSRAFTGGQMYAGLGREVYAANLTSAHPEGPGAHGESIVRAMRTGMGGDGLPLCSRMPGGPGGAYAQLSDDDARTIASYLASLPSAGDMVRRACDAP